MLLIIEQNTVTEKTHLIIQTILKKLQKTKINYGIKFDDHTNEDSQFQELMTMDNKKSWKQVIYQKQLPDIRKRST